MAFNAEDKKFIIKKLEDYSETGTDFIEDDLLRFSEIISKCKINEVYAFLVGKVSRLVPGSISKSVLALFITHFDRNIALELLDFFEGRSVLVLNEFKLIQALREVFPNDFRKITGRKGFVFLKSYLKNYDPEIINDLFDIESIYEHLVTSRSIHDLAESEEDLILFFYVVMSMLNGS